jgi:Astacin (Peptidase family M12A)
MSVHEGCSRGNIIHELLHALGFEHMHITYDRDEYVDINWDNIKENFHLNFKKSEMYLSMFGTSCKLFSNYFLNLNKQEGLKFHFQMTMTQLCITAT